MNEVWGHLLTLSNESALNYYPSTQSSSKLFQVLMCQQLNEGGSSVTNPNKIKLIHFFSGIDDI